MSANPTLHFLCGKAGAGKSTVATTLAFELEATLISEDIWLARLFGDRMTTFDDYLAFAQRLRTVVGPLAIDLLSAGRSVILDFPANTKASRAWFRALFEQAGATHILHYVDTADQSCLEHIAKRNVERPEASHHITEEVFFHVSSFFEPPEAAEGFKLKVHRQPDQA